jgi:hypothetical protein
LKRDPQEAREVLEPPPLTHAEPPPARHEKHERGASVSIGLPGVGIALAARAAPAPAPSPSVKSNPAPSGRPPFFGAVKLREVRPDAPPSPLDELANLVNLPQPGPGFPPEQKPYTTSYTGQNELRYEVES